LYKKNEIPPAECYQKQQAPAYVKTGKKNQCCIVIRISRENVTPLPEFRVFRLLF
jgi:hypothetical protein